MKIKTTYYGDAGVGRIRVSDDTDGTVAYVHFGPADSFKNEFEAIEAAGAIIATNNKIQESKTRISPPYTPSTSWKTI
jgi:hypothetical protein